MTVRRTVLVSVAVVALVGLLAVGAFALVRDGRGGPPWAGGWHDGGWGRGWHSAGPDPERVRELRSDLATDLAGELDTSAAEVEGAFRAVAEQRLREAVDAGRIDEAAVADALAAYDEGNVKALLRTLWSEPATTERQ